MQWDNVFTMVLNPRKYRKFTELQEELLKIVVEEYGGLVPYGEQSKIAERVGCDKSRVSQLLNGYSPKWTAELKRRSREMIPLMDPEQRVLLLQHLLSDSMQQRKKYAQPLSGKDPVDIIEVIGKTASKSPEGVNVQATQNIQQNNYFGDMNEMNDEQLTRNIEMIRKLLRADDETIDAVGTYLDSGGDIVEGEYTEYEGDADGTAPVDGIGEEEEDITESRAEAEE